MGVALDARNELEEALIKGVAISIVLIRPTVENLFYRTIRTRENHDALKDVNSIKLEMEHQQLKCWAVLVYYQQLWQNQKRGTLGFRFFDSYINDRMMIIDDEVCFGPTRQKKDVNRWWSDSEISIQGEELFEEQELKFLEIWNNATPINWNDIFFREDAKRVTQNDVIKLLETI